MTLKDVLNACAQLATMTQKSRLFVRRVGMAAFLVDNKTACEQAARLLDEQVASDALLAVDLEGELARDGEIWLVQVGTASGQTFVFDLMTSGEHRAAIVAVLRRLLESDSVVKVMHDCRRDNEALHFVLGVRLRNVVDTQVLHEYVQRSKEVGRWQKSRRIGLNALLAHYGQPINATKSSVHQSFNENDAATVRREWTARPLARQLLDYAADDVRHLCACYRAMLAALQRHVDADVHALSKAHAQSYLLPEPKLRRLCFDADGTAVYTPLLAPPTDEVRSSSADNAQLATLLETLPAAVRQQIDAVLEQRNDSALVEIVVDHGRRPCLIFADDSQVDIDLPAAEQLSLVDECLKQLASQAGCDVRALFTDDNRAGLSGTLHRISAMRDRRDAYVGLTYRIGRHVAGAAQVITDLLTAAARKKCGFLLLGAPGSGKTTLLRDAICSLSALGRRVVVVDTSNEIAGDGATPHACIGRARRVQVKHRDKQHKVLVETLQNHTPEMIVVDEIGTVKEVMAAKTIGQRGATLVGTAHGCDLSSLMKNSELNGLVGGLTTATLGDAEMRQRGKDKKTVLERAGRPVFDVVVEVLGKQRYRIHTDVAATVDAMLAGRPYQVEERWLHGADIFSKRCTVNEQREQQEDWYAELVAQANALEQSRAASSV